MALTANASRSVKEQVLAMGMSGYITKPFKQDELLEIFQRLTKKKVAK